MDGDPAVRRLFAADGLALGEFHCWPDDPRWSRENRAEEGALRRLPRHECRDRARGAARGGDAQPCHVLQPRPALPPQLPHPRGDHCAFLLVEERRLAEAAGGEAGSFRFPVSHGPVEPRTYLLHRLDVRAAPSAGDGLLVEETLCRLLREALTVGLRLAGTPAPRRRAATDGCHADLVEATKELLASRLGDRLTLGEIARSVHSSPFHLARVFRARTGFTIHGYRNQLQLRAALDGLFEADADLASSRAGSAIRATATSRTASAAPRRKRKGESMRWKAWLPAGAAAVACP